MKDIFKKVISWIVDSSANPSQVSLTLRGALVATIPTIMIIVHISNINVGQPQLTVGIDDVVAFVQNALALVATAMVVYGGARKVWYSVFSPKVA